MTEFVGHQIDKYQIIDEIAKGGMATVYLARQENLDREVAIKILPRQFTHDDTFMNRFYREVEVIASLQHPHILPVYDFGLYEDSPYIVMAYLNGGTLSDLISEGPMEFGLIGKLVSQVAGALEYAHSKGIIHRDFKPSNVLLDEQGNAYLADFGLAKVLEQSSDITGTSIIGTPTYMAPEQANSPEITPAADIYAFGVTIFQMLSGKAPYEAPTAVGVLLAHAQQPIPQIRDIRPELSTATQNVIDKSMAKTIHDRYPTPSAVAHSLVQALKAETQESPATELGNVKEALMMTNMLGQIIFVDNATLKLIRRHHSEARSIIGKSIADVLGIGMEFAQDLLTEVGQTGAVHNLEFMIRDAFDGEVRVRCKAVATTDDNNEFVGADITLTPIMRHADNQEEFDLTDEVLSSGEETLLQKFFTAHMENLYDLVIQVGGKRLGRNLEKIINETAQRNVWPVRMENGDIRVDAKQTDADIYRALLAKGITYSVGLIGRKMVISGLNRVDKRLDPQIQQLVGDLMLNDYINDIL